MADGLLHDMPLGNRPKKPHLLLLISGEDCLRGHALLWEAASEAGPKGHCHPCASEC